MAAERAVRRRAARRGVRERGRVDRRQHDRDGSGGDCDGERAEQHVASAARQLQPRRNANAAATIAAAIGGSAWATALVRWAAGASDEIGAPGGTIVT